MIIRLEALTQAFKTVRPDEARFSPDTEGYIFEPRHAIKINN